MITKKHAHDLWHCHNEIEKAIEVSKDFMDNEKSYSKFTEDIELFLLPLVVIPPISLVVEQHACVQDLHRQIIYLPFGDLK